MVVGMLMVSPLPQGRSGADGARGLPGDTGPKVGDGARTGVWRYCQGQEFKAQLVSLFAG